MSKLRKWLAFFIANNWQFAGYQIIFALRLTRD